MDVRLYSEDYERLTRQMDAAYDQMPFALSLALNDALFETKQVLTDATWPRSVTVRNSHFLDWALHIEKATKENLSGAIYDSTPDQRAHLKMHADSGTKAPKGANLAIPSRNVDRSGDGRIRTSEKPLNLRNAVRIKDRIYQYQGSGKHRKLVFMYSLKPSVNIKADVPFRSDFSDAMRESTERHFVPRMMQAMRTR
jgi:hypothetical protein